MKIAYIGIDLFYLALTALEDAGCEILQIFTCQTDNITEFNTKICCFARTHKIPITLHPITRADIDMLKNKGCMLIVCGGYYHKIPVDKEIPMVNIHPSLLPIGRGAWPMPVTILRSLKKTGLSIHKIEETFDTGDILLQREVFLEEKENLLTLTKKLQALLPDMVHTLLYDFSNLYQNAIPQGEGEYWEYIDEKSHPLTPDTDAKEAELYLRAFYGYECIYQKDGQNFGITYGTCILEEDAPGDGFFVKGGRIQAEKVRLL